MRHWIERRGSRNMPASFGGTGMGRRVVWMILTLLVVAAAAPLVITALFSRALVFHPTAIDEPELAALAKRTRWSLARLEPEPGIALVGLLRPPHANDAPWLVFFGGNAFDLGSSQFVLEAIGGSRDWGLAVWAYRGYDGSTGEPTERGLFDDARRAVASLAESHGVRPERLVLIGQSLGTGVAVEVAAQLSRANSPPRGVVLVSPYKSIRALFEERVPLIPVGWAVRDAFDTWSRIDQVNAPVLIVHGAKDRLIAPSHGRAIAEKLGEKATFLLLEDRDHNDLWSGTETSSAVARFIEKLK